MAATYVVRLWDPDPWWHLATGRWIVEHHAIPRVDPFSFTVAGQPWRAVDWVADLAMYGSFAIAGVAGVGALTALSAFAMLLLLGLALRELALSTPTTASVVACAGVMVQGRYSMARPMMLGAVALCATLYLCARTWQRRDGERARDRSVLVAAPLFVVWSAIHPSAVLGLVVLAIFALAALATRHPAARVLVAAPLVALALGALGSSARALFGVLVAHERATLTLALTTEWAPTRLADRQLWIPALGTLASAIVVLATPRDRRRALPFVGCAAVGALLASRFARNLYEAILLAAPLVAIAVERAYRRLRARPLASAPLLVALVVGLVVPAIHVRLAPAAFDAHFGVGPDDGAVPTETLDLLRTLPAGRVMNDCTLGGWLIWQRIPVYCDGRAAALYREDDIERLFLPLYGDAAAIDAVADRYDIRYALARFDSDFERTLMRAPSSWLPLAYDREHSLFVRRRYAASLPRELVALDELRFARDGDGGTRWLDGWYRALAADPARVDRLQAEVIAAVGRCATSRALHAALAYLARAQPAIADRLERALEKN